jgi:hypothetical protein
LAIDNGVTGRGTIKRQCRLEMKEAANGGGLGIGRMLGHLRDIANFLLVLVVLAALLVALFLFFILWALGANPADFGLPVQGGRAHDIRFAWTWGWTALVVAVLCELFRRIFVRSRFFGRWER